MIETLSEQQRYLTISPTDEKWGIVVTTVGYQFIPPGGAYPPSMHPDSYRFRPRSGRVLDEYQLVYITKGRGTFTSRGKEARRVSAGTVMLLFPGEWHSYHPDEECGWDEYWIGFRGDSIDERIARHFLSPEKPLLRIGLSATLIELYATVLRHASEERPGYQQLIAGAALYMLGIVCHKARNNTFTNAYVTDKINEARLLMKATIEDPPSPKAIAARLGLSYSQFRRMFKEYTGVSPARYQAGLRLARAKELLAETGRSISEIAYSLRFESAGQFSTFFRKHEGTSPSLLRERFS